jgi:hypothetical protein
MRSFRAMLDQTQPGQPVTVVWGDGGIGKSTLLDLMEEECDRRNLSRAKVLWNETRNHDFLGVMRKLRDDLGADRFSQFNSLVNFFTAPPTGQARLELVVGGAGINVGENLRNQGTIGSITGAEVKIEDLNVAIPRADLGISDSERMARLTDVFLQDLWATAAANPPILFLDAFEKASEITRNWVRDELVGALFDGRLEKVRIVISGRARPPLPNDWWVAVNEMLLAPLDRDYVVEYIDKSQLALSAGSLDDVVDMLLASTEGVPGRLDGAVRAFARQRERRAA